MKSEQTLGGPALFGRTGLILLTALLAVSVWFDQAPLARLTGLVLAAGLTARAWSRLSLKGVAYERRLDHNRAFPGDEITLTLTLANRKPLPLARIEAADLVPETLADEAQNLILAPEPGARLLVQSMPLWWYRRAGWTARLICRKRGCYFIGPADLTSGDGFGFFSRRCQAPETDPVIVYPKLYSLAELGLPSRFPLGEAKADTRVFEDPSRTAGLRDYAPRDPFRSIHWKASARQQKLQVRVHEPTATLQVYLFLDVTGFAQLPEDDFENAVSLTASLAHHVIGLGHPAGCLANTRPVGGECGLVNVLPAAGQDRLVDILEALARVTSEPAEPFIEFFGARQRDLTWGATLALITAGLTQDLELRLEDLERQGYRAVIFLVGPGPGPAGNLAWSRFTGPAVCEAEAAV